MEHVFKLSWWASYRYDGRRKRFFLNKTKEEFQNDKEIHFLRQRAKLQKDNLEKTRLAQIKRDLEYFSTIPYEYLGEGDDDYISYQRPSSNGIGYVSICVGERGNNYYVDDPITVAILKRKYENYKRQIL